MSACTRHGIEDCAGCTDETMRSAALRGQKATAGSVRRNTQQAPEAPEPASLRWRTLWKAILSIQGRKVEMLFRESEDFSEASQTAVRLVESSPGAEMTGAVIISVTRIATLWN